MLHAANNVLPLYLVLAGLLPGAALLAWSWRRSPAPAVREGAARTRIADLAPGRFCLTGRVVPICTVRSEIDGAACVYLERARYEYVGGGIVPLLREVAHDYAAHRFYVDDGSARILVDPGDALVDCATATGDGGLVVERRLRAGEEIELIGLFRPSDRPSEPDLGDEGPYRAAAARFEVGPDAVGPPRISYRTDENMVRGSPDEVTTFLRGAGVLIIATSLLFGGAVLWLQWSASFGG
jgi:hypothetical protein